MILAFLSFLHIALAQDPSSLVTEEFVQEEAMIPKTSRCQFHGEEVAKAYTRWIRKAMDGRKKKALQSRLDELPLFLPNDASHGNFDSARTSNMLDVVVQGFLHPGIGYFQLVPGLGLGANLTPKDIVYVCLDYSPEENQRSMTLYFLEPKITLKDEITYQRKLVTLGWRPISGIANILDGLLKPIPLVGWLYDRIHNEIILRALAVVQKAWNLVLRATIYYGAYKIKIYPHELQLYSELRILTKAKKGIRINHIKYESPWLLDNPKPPKEPGHPEQ